MAQIPKHHECTTVETKGFLLSGELVTLSCTSRP